MKKNYLLVVVVLICITIKVNAQAPDWLWAKGIGGAGSGGSVIGGNIAIDAAGNIYTTGSFGGTVDFDPDTSVTFNFTTMGNGDIFVTKLDNSGNFIWAKQMGGTGNENSYSIYVDASANVYTTGEFTGNVDFDPGVGTFYLNSWTLRDIFISKLDSAGNFIWAKRMGGGIGGGEEASGSSIAVDASGNVYTAGHFEGTIDFDPGSGIFNLTSDSAGTHDIFIIKLDSAGNFVWAKRMGGVFQDDVSCITLESSGNVYTTGSFSGTVDFDPGPGVFNITSISPFHIFISKLDSAGNFIWAKAMGGISTDGGNSIALDASGNVYTTGLFGITVDFDPGIGVFNLISNGWDDIFILKLDSSGNFIWAKGMGGGIYNDYGNDIAVDDSGSVYTIGNFGGTVDFNPDSSGILNFTSAGNNDIFISKLDSMGNFVWAKQVGGTDFDGGISLALDVSSNAYIGGSFLSPSLSFDSTLLTNASSFSDIFIAKLGDCSAHFTLYADTIPHNWIAVNQATGVAPLTYLWNWGDGNTSTGPTPSHIYNTPGYYNICLTITDATGCTSTYCDSSTYIFRGNSNNAIITINVILTTNIVEQNVNENGVIVYPNPTGDVITINSTINFPATEIILYDASGREVIKTNFPKVSKLSESFSVKHLNAGIYFYKIKDAKGNEVRGKVVKE